MKLIDRVRTSGLSMLMQAFIGSLSWGKILTVVTSLKAHDLSGEAKRGIVLDTIKEWMTLTGMNLSGSLINLAIEAAVQVVKNK